MFIHVSVNNKVLSKQEWLLGAVPGVRKHHSNSLCHFNNANKYKYSFRAKPLSSACYVLGTWQFFEKWSNIVIYTVFMFLAAFNKHLYSTALDFKFYTSTFNSRGELRGHG